MSSRDVFSMAIRNLFKRKLRTFLTLLGVIIGTASVIVMISLGLAMTFSFNNIVDQLGDITTITVRRPNNQMQTSPDSVTRIKGSVELDDNAIATFKTMKGVVAASPIVNTNLYLKSGKYVVWGLSIIGLEPSAMSALGFEPTVGSLLDPTIKYNMVFGSDAAYQFYNPNDRSNNYFGRFSMSSQQSTERPAPKIDPMNDRIQWSYHYGLIYDDWIAPDNVVPPAPVTAKVNGVLKPKGYQYDNAIIMSLTDAKKIADDMRRFDLEMQSSWGSASAQNQTPNKTTGYETAYVKCTDLNTVKRVWQEIKDMGYPAEIPTQQLESMKQVSESLQALLAAVGAVSLFVSALGIANTMVMSMYERTREIGVMKVIGAALNDIRKLFLLEAALIGFMGGLFGLALSFGISYFLNSSGVLSFIGSITDNSRGGGYYYDSYGGYYGGGMTSGGQQSTIVSMITPSLCAYSLLFATLVGLLSGYFPANRAMNLSALTAIKAE